MGKNLLTTGKVHPSHGETGRIVDAALTFFTSGFSVIPTGQDMRSLLFWKEFQKRPMATVEARQNFAKGTRLAVAGKVTGNLECIDFDHPETFVPFLDLLALRSPGLVKG